MKDVEIPPRKNGIVGPFSYGAIIPQGIRKLNILETVEVYDGYGRIQWDLVWKSKHGTRRVYPKACNDVIEPVAGIVSLDRRSSIIREYREDCTWFLSFSIQLSYASTVKMQAETSLKMKEPLAVCPVISDYALVVQREDVRPVEGRIGQHAAIR